MYTVVASIKTKALHDLFFAWSQNLTFNSFISGGKGVVRTCCELGNYLCWYLTKGSLSKGMSFIYDSVSAEFTVVLQFLFHNFYLELSYPIVKEWPSCLNRLFLQLHFIFCWWVCLDVVAGCWCPFNLLVATLKVTLI